MRHVQPLAQPANNPAPAVRRLGAPPEVALATRLALAIGLPLATWAVSAAPAIAVLGNQLSRAGLAAEFATEALEFVADSSALCSIALVVILPIALLVACAPQRAAVRALSVMLATVALVLFGACQLLTLVAALLLV